MVEGNAFTTMTIIGSAKSCTTNEEMGKKIGNCDFARVLVQLEEGEPCIALQAAIEYFIALLFLHFSEQRNVI
jgi:hypothetical protein